MAYNVIDVSNYIIEKSIDNGKPISNLKLQKLLYYVQGYFLSERSEPCFNEDICHWRHGPVVKEAYDKYKKYFDRKINEKQFEIDYDLDEELNLIEKKTEFDRNVISEKDREDIDYVTGLFEDKSAWDMVEMTHQEDPWKNSKPNDVIRNIDIQVYFMMNGDVFS